MGDNAGVARCLERLFTAEVFGISFDCFQASLFTRHRGWATSLETQSPFLLRPCRPLTDNGFRFWGSWGHRAHRRLQPMFGIHFIFLRSVSLKISLEKFPDWSADSEGGDKVCFRNESAVCLIAPGHVFPGQPPVITSSRIFQFYMKAG